MLHRQHSAGCPNRSQDHGVWRRKQCDSLVVAQAVTNSIIKEDIGELWAVDSGISVEDAKIIYCLCSLPLSNLIRFDHPRANFKMSAYTKNQQRASD